LSIVAGGVFVMGLVVADTLSDYRDAERAPTDLAAGLYAILREAESFEEVSGLVEMPSMPRDHSPARIATRTATITTVSRATR
jgi:hypothetical protein